jgi:hypothetical protein
MTNPALTSVDIEDDGSKHAIGQCDDGNRANPWLFLSVIYDPIGLGPRSDLSASVTGKEEINGFFACEIIEHRWSAW